MRKRVPVGWRRVAWVVRYTDLLILQWKILLFFVDPKQISFVKHGYDKSKIWQGVIDHTLCDEGGLGEFVAYVGGWRCV